MKIDATQHPSIRNSPTSPSSTLKVVVIGGTGLIGSKLVSRLTEKGYEALAASPRTGVNSLTREGLSKALQGASVVVDASNAPSFEDAAVLDFFETSTRNLLAAEAEAGVRHHVALSVVGTDRTQESGYLRAKAAQEWQVKRSSIPFSILRATQFFEFVKAIGDAATLGNSVRLSPVYVQPIAADDVSSALCRIATGSPRNGVVEIAGPKQYRLDELVRRVLASRNDPRKVITDPFARYFGATLGERSLLPAAGAQIGAIDLEEWQSRQTPPR